MATGYTRGKVDPMWWMAQIRSGTEHRNKLTNYSNWNEWRNYYRNQFALGVLPVNIFFKMIRTMVPRIYFRNPQVSITPRKGQQGQLDYAVLAMLLERIDNTLIDQMRLKYSMKRAVQDGIMFGTGVLKLGYGGEFTPTPELVDSTEAPTDEKNFRFEYNSLVQPNMPWALRVQTKDFVTPAGCPDWYSARWCAMRTRRHVDDVRDDPRFKHVKDLNPGTSVAPGEFESQKQEGMVDLFEVRDKKSRRVFVLAPYASEKVLFEGDDDLQYKGKFPYFPIQFNTDDEYFWAVPDSHIMAPHQKEQNAIRSAMQKHRRISLVKFILKQGAMTPDEQTKLNSDEVGAVVQLDDEASMNDLKELQAADIPAGLIKMAAAEDQTIQEILGMGVNQFGEYAPGSADRSATEAMIVNQSTQIRTDERRDTVADCLTDLIEHMNHLILDKWEDNEQVTDIIGPDGTQVWVQFKPHDAKGLDYDVKVDPDSSIPETKQVRQDRAQKVYQAFIQNPLMDPQKLTRYTLGEMGGPPLVDLMKSGQSPQIGAPGTPGSQPGNPLPVQQLITQLAARGGPRAA